ncbi:MAG TPA: fasciclin domain-containing protein, partial [Paracoccaceae bacterium]|nr:fasciclin domain-containing protein [Paracoccaceae bacterium]HMO73170.1 fasciclin domain-containing protein [Paracoccaceae bacterium]
MTLRLSLSALAVVAAAGAALAANPMVGGAPMFADKNIVENAVNSADHT